MDIASLVADPMMGELVVHPHVITVTGEVLFAYINVWWQIAQFVAAIAISYALAPKPKPPKPAAFEDFDFPQFDEGTPQAVIFGDCWTGDWMVLGVGNYRVTPIKSSGGKK